MLLRACAVAALVAVSLVACGSSPGDPATGQSSEALVCAVGDETPPCGQRPPYVPPTCESTTPECVVRPTTWAGATPEGLDATAQAEATSWIAALEQLGCSTPVQYEPTPTSLTGLAVTTCPVPLSSLPPIPAVVYYETGATTEADLELGCNHCFPAYAPAGSVRIGWDWSAARPGGCKSGSCDSLPPQ